MSTERGHAPRGHHSAGSSERPKARSGGHASRASRVDPFELEELIRMACSTPAREIDPEVFAVLHTAARRTPEFSLRLALTALRLEQRLREAQERVIQLQWELAQCKRPRARAADDR